MAPCCGGRAVSYTHLIDLEQWAGDIRNAKLVFFEDEAGFGDLLGVKLEQIFVPHPAQLDPLHAKFLGGDFAGMTKVLGNLVVDDSNSKG